MTTAAYTDAPARTRRWHWDRTRAALAEAARRGATMVSAARRHNWSPALTISGLGFIDAAIWTTYHLGAGLAAIGASLLLLDWSRDR